MITEELEYTVIGGVTNAAQGDVAAGAHAETGGDPTLVFAHPTDVDCADPTPASESPSRDNGNPVALNRPFRVA